MAKITQKERDEQVQNKVDRGNILCRATIHVVGTPKEHVEEAIKTTIKGIKDHEEIRLLEQKLFKAEKTEGEGEEEDVWSAFAEVEILCKNVADVAGFCFDFMPSSIEIIEPEKLAFPNDQLTGILNDINTKLHQIEMGARRYNVERRVAMAKMNSLIRYGILRALERAEHTKEELLKEIGIDDKGMEEFLESLTKKGEVEQKGKKYKSTGKVKTKK